MLEAELAVFEADYTREVVTVLAQLHDVEARILERTGDSAAARARRIRGRAARPPRRTRSLPPPDPVPPACSSGRSATRPSACTRTSRRSDDARSHAEAFMKRLNDAYRAGDAEAIADLVRQWESSPFAEGPGGPPRPAGAQPRGSRPRSRAPSAGSTSCASPSSPA